MPFIRTSIVLFAFLTPVAAGSPWALQASAQEPGSTRLFTLPEHDLYPENIAYDATSGDFFLSSMGQSRILRIHPDGSYEDFVSGLEPFLESSVGMKIDAVRRRLWVCTGRYTLFGGPSEVDPRTGVLLFDLDSGSLIQSWLVDQPSPGHIFNDLALASSGEVYVTTTLMGKVFRVTEGQDSLDLVLDAGGLQNNGIVLGPHERYLFLTLDRSISRLDLETGEVSEVPVPGGAGVGTDGLYFIENSLVVLRPRLRQVTRFYLDPSLETVTRVEVLAEGDPDFDYPTTGVLVGDTLVFVATSFADIPRNADAADQHPDVLIHYLPLRGSPTPPAGHR